MNLAPKQIRNRRKQEDRAWKSIQPWFNRQTAAARAFLRTKGKRQKKLAKINLGLRPLMPWYPRWEIAKWSDKVQRPPKALYKKVLEMFQYQGRLQAKP